MNGAIVIIFIISVITNANVSLKIDSMLGGQEISLGPFYSSVSVGNLSKKYHKLNPEDVKATGNIAELIELLRRMFGVGIFTLPPLDPFTSNKLKALNIGPETFISGKVLLNSLTVTGAKHFDFKLIELRMKTGRVDFEVDIPKLNFTVQQMGHFFTVNFKTDLYLGGLIPLSLKGQLRGNIDKLQLSGALQTEVRLRKSLGPNVVYQVSGGTVNVRAKDIKVGLVNEMHLDNDFLQSIYAGEDNSSSLSQWVASTSDMVTKNALNTFISLANDVLRSLSVVQVNAYLQPEDNVLKH